MRISEDGRWNVLSKAQRRMDEPSADPSAVAPCLVDMIATRKVKAALSEEGADELSGGGRIHQAPLANAKMGWAPKGLLQGHADDSHSAGNRRGRVRRSARPFAIGRRRKSSGSPSPPFAGWLRENRHCEAMRALFISPEEERFFDTEELFRLLDEHRAGADRSRKMRIVAMFLA